MGAADTRAALELMLEALLDKYPAFRVDQYSGTNDERFYESLIETGHMDGLRYVYLSSACIHNVDVMAHCGPVDEEFVAFVAAMATDFELTYRREN